VKKQNADFETESKSLLSRMDGLPSTIENANNVSNIRVKNDVTSEIDRMTQSLSVEQNRYIQSLETTRSQIQSYVEQAQSLERSFSDKTATLTSRVDGIPNIIDSKNAENNAQIRTLVSQELTLSIQKFTDQMLDYQQKIEAFNSQVKQYLGEAQKQETLLIEKSTSIIEKINESIEKILRENEKANAQLMDSFAKLLEAKRTEFDNYQQNCISSMEKTQSDVKQCETRLEEKHAEFIETLRKMNISNLYDQNVQLKKELNVRTTILMVISGISIIIGIIGLFI